MMTGLDIVLVYQTALWFGVLVFCLRLRNVERCSSIQAASLSEHFQRVFYHLTNIKHKSPQFFHNMLVRQRN
jgi:hypothetical protein